MSSPCTSFQIKYVDQHGNGKDRLPVLIPPAAVVPPPEILKTKKWIKYMKNTYNPHSVLPAVVNTLLIRGDIQLPNYGSNSISIDDITNLLVNYGFESGDADAVMKLMEEITTLKTNGLEVHNTWTDNSSEEDNRIDKLTVLFKAVGVPVVNGCVKSAQDDPTLKDLLLGVDHFYKSKQTTTTNATPPNAEDIINVQTVCLQPVIDVFDRSDTFLKWVRKGDVKRAKKANIKKDKRMPDVPYDIDIPGLLEKIEEAKEILALAMSEEKWNTNTTLVAKLQSVHDEIEEVERCAHLADEIEEFLMDCHKLTDQGRFNVFDTVHKCKKNVCVVYHDGQFTTVRSNDGIVSNLDNNGSSSIASNGALPPELYALVTDLLVDDAVVWENFESIDKEDESEREFVNGRLEPVSVTAGLPSSSSSAASAHAHNNRQQQQQEQDQSDHEMAMRMQMGNMFNSEEEDLKAALALSLRESGGSNNENAPPPARSDMKSHPSGGGVGPGVIRRVPNKVWNVELAVALEVRSKYFMDLDMTSSESSYDLQPWELWDRGANAIRACNKTIRHENDLPYLDDKVRDECTRIIRGLMKSVPEKMMAAAMNIVFEERLMRKEEHECLQKLVDDDVPELEEHQQPQPAVQSGQQNPWVQSTPTPPPQPKVVLEPEVAALKIQSLWRGYNIRCDFKRRIKAVIWYQSAFRRYSSRKGFEIYKKRRLYLATQTSTLVRGFLVRRRRYKDKSVTRIEALSRGFLVRRRRQRRNASTRITSLVRGFLARRQLEKTKSATCITSVVRGFMARRHLEKTKSATRITSLVRGYLARKQFVLMVVSANRINAVCRGRLARSQYRDTIMKGYEERMRLNAQWKLVKSYVEGDLYSPKSDYFSWSYIKKNNFDMEVDDDDDEGIDPEDLDETSARLSAAFQNTLLQEEDDDDEHDDNGNKEKADQEEPSSSALNPSAPSFTPAAVAGGVGAPGGAVAMGVPPQSGASTTSQQQQQPTTNATSVVPGGNSPTGSKSKENIPPTTAVVQPPPPPPMKFVPYGGSNDGVSSDNILLTHAVLKWYKKANHRYKDMFLGRMRQLANGERSRILQKRLTGSKHTIYETYLDMAVALRIIWTECKEEDNDASNHNNNNASGRGKSSILVWFVSKHEWVSRFMEQIDKAEARKNRQFKAKATDLLLDTDDNDETSESGSGESEMVIDAARPLLDPTANVPLKIHQMEVNEVDQLEKEAWTPPLRLTPAEKSVVQKPGTVLVLGRSGTGKTICICNRMVCDANFHRGAATLRQLFIARSPKIKNLVQRLVTEEIDVDQSYVERNFVSYERITKDCDAAFNRLGKASTLSVVPGQQLRNFADFKEDFFKSIKKEVRTKLSALVIWTQIRSYIKGSIEAVKVGRPLNQQEYLALGASKCRLSPQQRCEAYKVYLKYSQWCKSNKYYDACDRTADLLIRFGQTQIEDRIQEKIKFDKIYVDEVQDFTNSDVALFWMLCEGGGSLFLAGDTAQSVEQGIEFRFDDVRSICHYLGGEDKRNVPDKPLNVTLNFRSHTGVLDVAAALLKILHEAFPGAANKLPDDEGLFKGPRPCILSRKNQMNIDIQTLQGVLTKNPGLVVLTPDENVESLKSKLGDSCEKSIILGICEAKGLDFDEIVIVDFFSISTKRQEKAWKDLFINSSSGNNSRPQRDAWEMSQFPELQMRIKLLYTGITRCRHRLFFAETNNNSTASNAFTRWLLGTELAEKQDIADLSLQLKSPEEWRSLGVDYALNGESSEEADGAAAWFERAANCFKNGGDSELESKARFHSRIRSKRGTLMYRQDDWETIKGGCTDVLELCFNNNQDKFVFVDEVIDICDTILDSIPPSSNERILKDIVDEMLETIKTKKGDIVAVGKGSKKN